ncbi:MAG TPA: S1 family peptidase [Polyangiales bacterium]
MQWRMTWLLCVMAGCAVEQAEEQDELQYEAIIHGKASTAAQDAVVMIRIGDQALCTGTLVAPNLVLTARHCVSQTEEGIACAPSGAAIQGGGVGADFRASSLVIYGGRKNVEPIAKGKRILHDESDNLCDHDVALVLLDREVQDLPIAALRLTDHTQVGEKITAVGWGLTQKGTLPTTRMQRANVPIIDVGPSTTAAPHEMAVGEAICSGDSGGPALSAQGAVIGVVSYGGNGSGDWFEPAASCLGKSTRNTYTRVAPFAALIDAAFKAAKHTPQREGAP